MSSNSNSVKRSSWSGTFVFIMATIGSAVGLGAIWKFPYMTGTYGGSAFVLVYFLCSILLALPLAMGEILLGKIAQANPADSLNIALNKSDNFVKNTLQQTPRLTFFHNKNLFWKTIGLLAIISPFLVCIYYPVVGGWVLHYGYASIAQIDTTTTNYFSDFLNSPYQQILWHFIFLLISTLIVGLGVDKGIGNANVIMMPGLFFILLTLLGFGIAYGNFDKSFEFLFHFDLSQITPKVVLAALGQAFFSTSLGLGILICYGSYISHNNDIASNTFVVVLANIFVSILAGLAIFSFVFATDLQVDAGPSLIFRILPIAFTSLPFTHIIEPLFYILLIFAVITSMVSILEPLVSFLMENFPKLFCNRFRTLLAIFIIMWKFGIIVSLSSIEGHYMEDIFQNILYSGLGLFDFLDKLSTTIIIPLAALPTAIFVGYAINKTLLQQKLNLTNTTLFNIWFFMIKYIAPVGIVIIFLMEFIKI